MKYPSLFYIVNMLEYSIIDANNMYSYNKNALNDQILKLCLPKRTDDNLVWFALISENIIVI